MGHLWPPRINLSQGCTLNTYIFYSMNGCFTHMYVCAPGSCSTSRDQKRKYIRSSGTGIIQDCDQPLVPKPSSPTNALKHTAISPVPRMHTLDVSLSTKCMPEAGLKQPKAWESMPGGYSTQPPRPSGDWQMGRISITDGGFLTPLSSSATK